MPRPSNGNPGLPFATVDPAALRTLALVGPQASGKTSLAEALLHRAGMVTTPGSLERGSTVSDHDPLERRMQHCCAYHHQGPVCPHLHCPQHWISDHCLLAAHGRRAWPPRC